MSNAAQLVRGGRILGYAYAAYLAARALRGTLVFLRNHYLLSKIPGPPPRDLFLGNLRDISDNPPGQPFLKWALAHGQHGVMCYRMMYKRKLVVLDPAEIRKVLISESKNFPKPENEMRFLKLILGSRGLVCVQGADHTKQRRVISQAFKFEALQGIFPAFTRQADKMAAKWEALADKGETTLADSDFAAVTLDALGEAAFGVDFGALDGRDSEIRDAYKAMFPTGGSQALQLVMNYMMNQFSLLARIPLGRVQTQKTANKVIDRRVLEVVTRRREGARRGGGNGADLLGHMLDASDAEAGGGFSDEEVIDNVKTFLFAGHETTSGTLSFATYELARDQALLAKARAEVKSVVGSGCKTVTYKDTEKMPLVNAIIKESLRMYPPVIFTFRETARELDMCGYTVPKGTQVLVHPYVYGRLPEWWDKPNDFMPERWLGDDPREKSNPYRFLPFLLGSRQCVGNRFALYEAATILSTLILRLDFKMPDDHPEVFGKQRPTLRLMPKLELQVARAK